MTKIEQLEKFLLNNSKPHCEIDRFYLDRLIEYMSGLCDDEIPNYAQYKEYIHSFIDNELSAIWYDINKEGK